MSIALSYYLGKCRHEHCPICKNRRFDRAADRAIMLAARERERRDEELYRKRETARQRRMAIDRHLNAAIKQLDSQISPKAR